MTDADEELSRIIKLLEKTMNDDPQFGYWSDSQCVHTGGYCVYKTTAGAEIRVTEVSREQIPESKRGGKIFVGMVTKYLRKVNITNPHLKWGWD
jgi:hypothetical protein